MIDTLRPNLEEIQMQEPLGSIILGTDTSPLAEPGTELSKSSEWIAELFCNTNNLALQAIPQPILDWNVRNRRRIWENAEPGSSKQELIERKIIHALNVDMKSFYLAQSYEEYLRNIRQVQSNSELHDTARPAQGYHFETYNDALSFDHALVGSYMIRYAQLPFAEFGCDEEIAIRTTRDHSKIKCDDTPYNNIMRDADKLVIWGEVLADLKAEHASGTVPRSQILPEAMQQFNAQENIDNIYTRKSPATRLLQRIGWMYDLNLLASKVDYIESGIPTLLLQFLEIMTGERNLHVEQAVNQWQDEVMSQPIFTQSLQTTLPIE